MTRKELKSKSLQELGILSERVMFNSENTGVLTEYFLYRALLNFSGSEIVEQLADSTQQKFQRVDAVPVMICAFNEENDLPITLAALARSNIPVNPIIIDNNSSDKTARYAEKMGAMVLTENKKGLIHALKKGFKYFLEKGHTGPILLTDADTFPRSSWASSMVQYAQLHLHKTGGETFSSVCFTDQDLRLIDILRTSIISAFYLTAHLKGKVVHHGANGVIYPSENTKILEALGNINTTIVRGTDALVKDTVKKADGKVTFHWNKDSIVFTKGDRYTTIKDLIKVIFSSTHREKLYSDWYQSQKEFGTEIYQSDDTMTVGKFKI